MPGAKAADTVAATPVVGMVATGAATGTVAWAVTTTTTADAGFAME